MEWFEDTDNVTHLANALHDADTFKDIPAVIYFFEKPYKWTREWGILKGRGQEALTEYIENGFSEDGDDATYA